MFWTVVIETLLGATRWKCSQTGENLLFLANSMMNNERDVSIDTTENAMLKLLRSQTSGILNIPQGCDRIRDIFIVEISRQYWTHISKQKPEAKPRTSHPTSFRQCESYSKRSFAGGGAEILDTRLDASTQNVTSLHRTLFGKNGDHRTRGT